MADLSQDVKYVKGVGPNRVVLLNRLGIYTLEDLISYYPREHEDRSKVKPIAELVDGEETLIRAMAVSRISEVRIRKGFTLYKLIVRDESGTCQITWYNQSYIKNYFKPGQIYQFYGKVSKKYGNIDMQAPVFDNESSSKNTGKIIPIYPLTAQLSQATIRKIIENGLGLVEEKIEETLPEEIRKDYHLMDLNTATHQIHFPDTFLSFEKARKRLVFEELFAMQLALLTLKNQYAKETEGIAFSKEVHMSDVIYQLPFQLTKAQLRVCLLYTSDAADE